MLYLDLRFGYRTCHMTQRKKTNIVFLLSQIVCSARGCRTSVKDIGHGTCRQHAPCRQVMDDDAILWNPDQCSVCREKVSIILDESAPKKARSTCKMELKAWGRGFHKNRPGLPFLTEDKWRVMLFPKTDKVMVYSGPNDKPTQDILSFYNKTLNFNTYHKVTLH